MTDATPQSEIADPAESTEPTEQELVDEGDIAADYIEELLDIADLDGDIDIDARVGRAYVSVSAAESSDLRVLSKPDTRYVACSDRQERERVRKNFLEKKLGLSGDGLETSIESVCSAMKADRTKSRLTFYYLLAEHHGKLDAFA